MPCVAALALSSTTAGSSAEGSVACNIFVACLRIPYVECRAPKSLGVKLLMGWIKCH